MVNPNLLISANNSRVIILVLMLMGLYPSFSFGQSNHNSLPKGRGQWTKKQAWRWQKRVGPIIGFNAPASAYPGMSREQVLKKASELGFNSVRLWIARDKPVAFLNKILDQAGKYGMTVSPVLPMKSFEAMSNQKLAKKKAKSYLRKIIGTFRHDSRIALWDLFNKPFSKNKPSTSVKALNWCKKIILWARAMSPSQPLTVSMSLVYPLKGHFDEGVYRKRVKVEGMVDVHNFHLYYLYLLHKKYPKGGMMKKLRSISNRPLVATEVIGRTIGGTFGRTLTLFSKYHVNFYMWGMYESDNNWDVSWGMSSFKPYEPMFNYLLHPDGSPYDYRELAWIRKFHFAGPGEKVDPGAEVTERWSKWRAWKWATGPVKGFSYMPKRSVNAGFATWSDDIKRGASVGYNAIMIKLISMSGGMIPLNFFLRWILYCILPILITCASCLRCLVIKLWGVIAKKYCPIM
jgi:hypothetical protein